MSEQELPTVYRLDVPVLPGGLLEDLRTMIDETKQTIATTVNAKLTLLYWHIGYRIRSELLQNEELSMAVRLSLQCRDNWRKSMVKDLLKKSLRRMIQFSEVLQDQQVVNDLTSQLSQNTKANGTLPSLARQI